MYTTSYTTGGYIISDGTTNHSDYITFEYMEFIGPGELATASPSGGPRAFHFVGTGAGSASNFLLSHLWIHLLADAVYLSGDYHILEYIDFDHICNEIPGYHTDTVYNYGGNYFTFRYNRYHGRNTGAGNSGNEGIFWDQDTGGPGSHYIYIYGNIFYDDVNKAVQLGPDNCTNVFIYNNTWDNITDYSLSTASCTGVARNNITNNTTGWNSGSLTVSNNLNISNNAVFVNQATGDYHIVSTVGSGYPRNAGYNVGSPYNTDPDGVARGGDGTWDIGAYEYSTGSSTPSQVQGITITGGTVQ
jgi:hypothetical protein